MGFVNEPTNCIYFVFFFYFAKILFAGRSTTTSNINVIFHHTIKNKLYLFFEILMTFKDHCLVYLSRKIANVNIISYMCDIFHYLLAYDFSCLFIFAKGNTGNLITKKKK